MNVNSLVGEALGVVQTMARALVSAEPAGYVALAVMAFVVLRGAIDLRRHQRYLIAQRGGLAEHRRAVDAYVAAVEFDRRSSDDDEADADITEDADGETQHLARLAEGSDPEEAFDVHVRRRRADDHAGQVLAFVHRHRRLAAPTVDAVVNAARAFDVPELERQRRTPNVLMLIGLAGTVFGLASTVGQFDLGAVTGGGATAIGVMQSVVAQLPSAFVATIWGIVSALVFAGVVGRAEARVAHFVSELERVVVLEWIPALWPASLNVQYDDLGKAMRSTNRAVTNTRRLMKEMTDALNVTLSNTSGAMGTHVQDLARVSEDTRHAFQGLAEQVSVSVSALDRGSTGMREAVERLAGYHSDLRSAYARMGDLFQASQLQTKAHVDEMLEATRAQQVQFANATDGAMLAMRGVSRDLSGVAERVDRQHADLESVRDTLLAALASGFTRVGDGVSNELAAAVGGVSTATASLGGSLDGLRRLVAESVVGDRPAAVVGELTNVVRSLETAVARIDRAAEHLAAASDRFMDAVPGVLDRAQALAESVEASAEALAVRAHVPSEESSRTADASELGAFDGKTDMVDAPPPSVEEAARPS